MIVMIIRALSKSSVRMKECQGGWWEIGCGVGVQERNRRLWTRWHIGRIGGKMRLGITVWGVPGFTSPVKWKFTSLFWMEISGRPSWPESLSFEPGLHTCRLGPSADAASGQPLKMPRKAVLRKSQAHLETWKHQCDDFNLIWPADGSRQFKERRRDEPNWAVRRRCLIASQERAKAGLAHRLVGGLWIKGLPPDKTSCRPASLSGNNGGRRRKAKRKVFIVFLKEKVLFLPNNAKEKKEKPLFNGPRLAALRVPHLKKRKRWTLDNNKNRASIDVSVKYRWGRWELCQGICVEHLEQSLTHGEHSIEISWIVVIYWTLTMGQAWIEVFYMCCMLYSLQ